MGRIRSGLSNVGSVLTSLAKATVQRLSLVPVYLSHLLWLIERTFYDLAKQGYGGNSAVYAVVTTLCAAVAEPPLQAYAQMADGTIGDVLPYQHRLHQLIRSPNPFLTEYEHHELMMLHLVIAGRYTAWRERDNAGRTIALWPLRPDRVGPIYGDADAGEDLLIGWSYLVPGTTRYLGLRAEDVFFLNFADPAGESGGVVEGLGPLQVLAAEISADNKATEFVGALLANHAMPGSVIEVQTAIPDEDEMKLIKASFMRDFGGARRGEPAVIDKGSKITPMSFTLQELEFTALRNVSESRISAALRVPAILAGLQVGLEAGIKATTDELRAMFAEQTLVHHWRRFEDAWSNQIAPEFGVSIVCAFDLTKVRALAVQAAAELDRIRDAYVNGALTKNEYREALGFDDRPDGDVYVFGIAPGRGTETQVNPNGTPTAPEQGQPADQDPAMMADAQPAGIRSARSATVGARQWSVYRERRTIITIRSGMPELPSPIQPGLAQVAEGTHQLETEFDRIMADLSRGR